MNIERMLLKLYRYPIALFIAAIVAMYVFGSFIPNRLSGDIFSHVREMAINFAPFAGVFLLGTSVFWAIFNSFELWQWFKGKSNNICRNCGGMTNYHPNGRYGSYFKCMACGKNIADR